MGEREYVRHSIEERVATIVLDHPPVNAFNTQTLQELDGTLDELLGAAEVKVIVITGGGQLAFVAGADIGEISDLLKSKDIEKAQALLDLGKCVFDKIEQANKPVIAAINGICLGGGLEMAMACHLRIAGDRVRLGQPEINLGIIPGWGGTQRLPRIVGPSKATEMILTGDPITAQEAKAWGLVNMVVPGDAVMRQATGLARKIAAKSAVTVAAALEAIRRGLEASLSDGLAAEGEQFLGLSSSHDAAEGVAAFLEKRQPAFADK